MRNKDIIEALRAMEENFKQHSDNQWALFTASLEQYMISTNARLIELSENNNRRPPPPPPTHITAVMKTLHLNVPRFDGKVVEDWIYKINKLFTLHELALDTHLTMVLFRLDDETSFWYQWMENSSAINSWDDFLREVHKCFSPSVYEDPLERASKLIQRDTIARFRSEFEKLMTRTNDVNDDMFLNFFISGLKPEIRRELFLSQPTNLADAIDRAQLYEDKTRTFVGDFAARSPADEFSWCHGPCTIVSG